jgi:hypothetical protein
VAQRVPPGLLRGDPEAGRAQVGVVGGGVVERVRRLRPDPRGDLRIDHVRGPLLRLGGRLVDDQAGGDGERDRPHVAQDEPRGERSGHQEERAEPRRPRGHLALEEMGPLVRPREQPPVADPPPEAGVGVRLDPVARVEHRDRHPGPAQRRHPLHVRAEGAPDVGEHHEVELPGDGAVWSAVAVDGGIVVQQAAEREPHPVQPAQALGRVARVQMVDARHVDGVGAEQGAQPVEQAVDEEVVVAGSDQQDARHRQTAS